MKASSDYSEGFNSSGSRQVSRTRASTPSAATPKRDRSNFFNEAGPWRPLADILSGSTAVANCSAAPHRAIEATGVSAPSATATSSGNLYADVVEKGRLFRSDKRYTEFAALPEELGRFLGPACRGADQGQDFGAALGLPATQLAEHHEGCEGRARRPGRHGRSHRRSARREHEGAGRALGGYGDALVAGYAETVKPLANYGETTAQTIQRVGESISGVNDILEALGLTALQASIDGGKAAIALQQSAFGGLSTLQQAASGYLQNYTDTERNALTRGAIGQTLGAAGLEVPATREAFRALVDAQDLMTESGRRAFTALMSVQDAFAAITESGRSAADILNERNDIEERRLTCWATPPLCAVGTGQAGRQQPAAATGRCTAWKTPPRCGRPSTPTSASFSPRSRPPTTSTAPSPATCSLPGCSAAMPTCQRAEGRQQDQISRSPASSSPWPTTAPTPRSPSSKRPARWQA